jgi:hypothetical protein
LIGDSGDARNIIVFFLSDISVDIPVDSVGVET